MNFVDEATDKPGIPELRFAYPFGYLWFWGESHCSILLSVP